ncbi:O-antigen ligase family protein [Paraburkholderia sp.]|uniref:O-antigen ligase family protein n=1 Tax=Paraburkholderia sp. TaxID=1926495 RepID=UPI003D6F3254
MSSHKAARIERVLWVACPVILFIVMFGHMTALEYNALGLLAIGTLAAACSTDRPHVTRWPLLVPILAWAAWSSASIAWSAYPAVSAHAWLDEVLYPLVSFWGFWLLATRIPQAERFVLVSVVACVLLTLVSATFWGQLQPPTADIFPLHFYNRVGHTSTLAVLAMPLFTGLLLRSRWRAAGVVGIVLCLFIGLATLNRFFWPAAAVTLLIALFPFYRQHLLLAGLVIVVIGAATVGTLEYSSRMRIGSGAPLPAHADITIGGHQLYLPKSLTAIGDTVSGDTRPKVWAFYGHAGEPHTWTGIGFGKPLPGLTYGVDAPPKLLQIEPQALTHAHNLFLNTWLQTGVIGVVLESALLLAVGLRFWRLRRADPWIGAAGIALVVGMIAKNTTDDFMWQTTMLAFWSFSGLLLGAGERRAGLVPAARRVGGTPY